MVILRRWRLLLNELDHSRDASSFGVTGPRSVDEDIVQDRHQPNPQIVSGTKARASFVGTNERVVHQILGVDLGARERPRVAAQARHLAEHVEAELSGYPVSRIHHGVYEADGATNPLPEFAILCSVR